MSSKCTGKAAAATMAIALSLLSAPSLAAHADLYSRPKNSASSDVSLTYAIEAKKEKKEKDKDEKAADKTNRETKQVTMRIQPSVDGYLYILAAGASDKQYDIVYPPAGSVDKGLKKGHTYNIPVTTSAKMKAIYTKDKLAIEPNGRNIIFETSSGLSLPFQTTLGTIVPSTVPEFKNQTPITVSSPDFSKALEINLHIQDEQTTSIDKPDTPAGSDATQPQPQIKPDDPAPPSSSQ